MIDRPQVVSEAEWRADREELLIKEKELTRQRDALAAEVVPPYDAPGFRAVVVSDLQGAALTLGKPTGGP